MITIQPVSKYLISNRKDTRHAQIAADFVPDFVDKRQISNHLYSALHVGPDRNLSKGIGCEV